MTTLFPLPELLMIGLFGASVVSLVVRSAKPMPLPVRRDRQPTP